MRPHIVLALAALACVHGAREGEENGERPRARPSSQSHRSLAAAQRHGEATEAAVVQLAQRHEGHASSDMAAELADMSGADLKEEFLAFLKSREHLHASTQSVTDNVTHNLTHNLTHNVTHNLTHKVSAFARVCAEEWSEYSKGVRAKQSKLFEGMKKVREAHVLLAAVDATKWSNIFAGSRKLDHASAEKVDEAVNIGGTLLGRLDGLGVSYDERLKQLAGEDQERKFIAQCEEHKAMVKSKSSWFKSPW